MLLKTSDFEIEIDLPGMLFFRTVARAMCIKREAASTWLPCLEMFSNGFAWEGFGIRIDYDRFAPRPRVPRK